MCLTLCADIPFNVLMLCFFYFLISFFLSLYCHAAAATTVKERGAKEWGDLGEFVKKVLQKGPHTYHRGLTNNTGS